MFKLYAVYCSNQHQVVKTLKACQDQNPQLREFLEVCSVCSDSRWRLACRVLRFQGTRTQSQVYTPQCRGLMLEDFLIQPLQRLCKYPLLFEVGLQPSLSLSLSLTLSLSLSLTQSRY
jgi:hypothetical protein